MERSPSPSLAQALRRRNASVEGCVLGPYTIRRELGRGAMGAVFEAHHRMLDRTVALKVLTGGTFADEHRKQRFVREARLACSLNYPGIVRTLDAGEADGLLYLAMELVVGETFEDRFEELTLDERVAVVFLVAEALAPAHAAGVIHRDLKPANIILAESDGRPRILDFGLGRDVNLASSLTQGKVVGTPLYMAPEQIRSEPPSPAADVFALGVMLYQSIAESYPFNAPNLAVQLAQILGGQPDPPSSLQPGASAVYDPICLRALNADPRSRYPFAAALAAELRPLVKTPGNAPGRNPRRLVAVLVLVAALLLGALAAALLWWPLRSSPPPPPVDPPPASAPTPQGTSKADQRFVELMAILDPAERLKAARSFLKDHPNHRAGETLVRDLRPWERRALAVGPSPRDGCRGGFVWDPFGERLLLFGGWNGRESFSDLWAYDGIRWTELPSVVSPPQRYAHAMTYDIARQRVVLFGGNTEDGKGEFVWEWSGETWALVNVSGPRPQGRAWHAFCHDPRRQVNVLFGGTADTQLNDVWEWDGEEWTERTTANGPTARNNPGVTFDPVRKAVMIFGGYGRGKRYDDLWAWDGRDWHEVPTKGRRPSPRQSMSLWHDGDHLFLWGGGSGASDMRDDLWIHAGDHWIELHPLDKPEARMWQATTYDPRRKVSVLFGGSLRVGRVFGDVWEYPGG